MNRYFLLASLCFLSVSASAQSLRFYATVQGNYQFVFPRQIREAFSIFEGEETPGIDIDWTPGIYYRSRYQAGKPGCGFGGQVEWSRGQRVSVRTGIQIDQLRYQVKFSSYDSDGSKGEGKSSYKRTLLTIPLLVQYQEERNRFAFFAGPAWCGFMAYSSESEATTTEADGTVTSSNFVGRSRSSALYVKRLQGIVGVRYHIAKRWTIDFSYAHTLVTYDSNKPVKEVTDIFWQTSPNPNFLTLGTSFRIAAL
ncbi:Outer membrane protein beta-barrel domain-containing protein [Catalinimonas alkaloidigena]|uniref:Outer membrane protein beta-barrel domain-containing protein n=1 Tax=Catalinimonas alkaloidigena TaxID=1075417 RepID=A0A1G9RM87_9BACT|nr:outer membrane beta-barrel protein [Catalinimonas alkaloidigena]SDM24368.1 Outer membrane protein beta-barrel domain-containing protein [Catalinimonas alkaloidigena]